MGPVITPINEAGNEKMEAQRGQVRCTEWQGQDSSLSLRSVTASWNCLEKRSQIIGAAPETSSPPVPFS